MFGVATNSLPVHARSSHRRSSTRMKTMFGSGNRPLGRSPRNRRHNKAAHRRRQRPPGVPRRFLGPIRLFPEFARHVRSLDRIATLSQLRTPLALRQRGAGPRAI